jgi:peptidoglycan hydrolase-like protein with peptidoglycan-binding domain
VSPRWQARLLETGDYGLGNDMARSVQTPAPPAPDADIMPWQQKLKDLGYYQGKVDGWHGPMFTAAVTAFQRAHPNLKPDGIMGPATIAAIQRASDAKAKANSASVVIVGATSAATVAAPQTGLWIALGIGLAGIVLACVILWSHRDEVQQYLNKNATG